MILGVDTSSSVVAVCLMTEQRQWIRAGSARSANELVAALTDAVLLDAGAKLSDIKRIGLAIGPGSFTGLRIGLAFCKGLCFGLRLPLYTVSSFEAAASVMFGAGHARCGVIAVTGKDRFAGCLYELIDSQGGMRCVWSGELVGSRVAAIDGLAIASGARVAVVDLSGGAVSDPGLNVSQVGSDLAVSVARRTGQADELVFSLGQIADIQPLYGREASFRTLAARGLAVGE